MRQILFIALQLGVLYWLSGQVHRHLQLQFYRILKTPTRVVWAMNILFWPGVLIHELAHLVVARLILVKAGKLSLVPKIQANGVVEMGSVQLPKQLDVFRFALIGLAPVYVGLAIILGLMWLGEQHELWHVWWWWLVVGYLMFEVGNTFFDSSSDMAWALRLSLILGLIFGIGYWAGWRPSVEWVGPWLAQYEAILVQTQWWLWVPIVIDAVLLAVLLGLRRGFRFGG